MLYISIACDSGFHDGTLHMHLCLFIHSFLLVICLLIYLFVLLQVVQQPPRESHLNTCCLALHGDVFKTSCFAADCRSLVIVYCRIKEQTPAASIAAMPAGTTDTKECFLHASNTRSRLDEWERSPFLGWMINGFHMFQCWDRIGP